MTENIKKLLTEYKLKLKIYILNKESDKVLILSQVIKDLEEVAKNDIQKDEFK